MRKGIVLYTPRPSYKYIQTMLKSSHDKIQEESIDTEEHSSFGITRGADYYKGGDD